MIVEVVHLSFFSNMLKITKEDDIYNDFS